MDPVSFALVLLRNTPWWVFVIFAWLVWLGWRRLRTRSIWLPLLGIDPAILLALTLPDLAQRAASSGWMPVATWIGSALGGVLVGHLTLRHLELQALPARRVLVPGSAIPLAVYLASFAKNYYFGYLFRRYPALQSDTEVILVQLALGGFFAGIMIGRVAALLRAHKRGQPLPAKGV